MALHRYEDAIRVFRIDENRRDLLRVSQAQMRPSRPGGGRFVDAVAGRKIRPLQAFAAADIDDVRVRGDYNDGPDGAAGLTIKYRIPCVAGVRRLPHTAVHRGDVENSGLVRHAGDGDGAAATEGSDAAPAHF